jgi:LacI family transcriptional regulator
MESGFQAMERLLALPNTPTAVFCSNDDMAIGAMNAIFAKGMRVPDDISVIGFDDIGFSQYITPRLSTVKRPVEKISVLGAKKLLALISTPDTKAEKIFENTEFMVRDSVKNVTT